MIKDFLLALAVLLPLIVPTIHGEIEKRQVGVLARSGVLPQGKRGLESLARNGELPGKRLVSSDGSDRQRVWSLLKWLQEHDALMKLQDELEQNLNKRNVEAMARSGYLVKPLTEAPEIRPDLLDPEDFLGKNSVELLGNDDGFLAADDKRGGLASLARHGYIGKRFENDNDSYDDFDDEDDLNDLTDGDIKRSVGAAKNFFNDKRNIASFKSFVSRYGKRNIGAFRNFNGKRNIGSARNFANFKRDHNEDEDEQNDWYDEETKRNIGSALRFSGKRSLGSARNFMFNEAKKNIGAARNFFSSGNKKNVGAARNFWHGKRNIASFARGGGFSNLKSSGRETDYPWDDDDDFGFDDFHDEDKRHIASFLKSQSGKRHLGSLRYAGKRNIAAFRNFGKRLNDAADALALASVLSDPADDVDDFLGKQLDSASTIEKRETKAIEAGQASGHPGLARRKRSVEYVLPPGELLVPGLSDYGDYEDDIIQNNVEKRFLDLEQLDLQAQSHGLPRQWRCRSVTLGLWLAWGCFLPSEAPVIADQVERSTPG